MSSQLDLGPGRPTTVVTALATVAALQAGPPDGSPVLLVPGYTGSKEDFGPILAPLADAGFAVTAIDQPGQFESPGPDDPAAYSPDILAQAVGAVAAAIGMHGPPVHLLGHSFGGLVARAAVLDDHTRWASLTLMCSGPAAIGGARRAVIERLEPLLAVEGLAAVHAAGRELARARAGWVEPSPELEAFLEHRFVTGTPAGLQGMGRSLREEPDRVDQLASCRLRTLVIYGEHDDAWPPADQDDMARRLGAERVVVPAAAHSPAVENPAPTAEALIAFWRDTA